MGTTCSYLNEFSNACEMYRCIKNINGLSSNSASPTDTWIVFFKNNTNYYDKRLDRGFMKLFIDPLSLSINTKYDTKYLHALKYELKVYKDIIRPLILHKICPFFIKYLGSTEECSFNNLLLMLKSALISSPEEKLLRSIFYMYKKIKNRPAIQTDLATNIDKNNKKFDIFKEIKYNFIITEMIEDKTITFERWLQINTVKTILYGDVWVILFQIAIACYSMSLSLLVHNDLHFGNIWVLPLKKPVKIKYIINGVDYYFVTNYKIQIYDFDRSYSPLFGDNILNKNSEYLCTHWANCNELFQSKDIFKVIVDLYLSIQNIEEKEKLNIILARETKDIEIVKTFINSTRINTDNKIENVGSFSIKPNGERMNTEDYMKISEMTDIISKICNYSLGRIKLTDEDPYNLHKYETRTFVCNPDMFDRFGRIKK